MDKEIASLFLLREVDKIKESVNELIRSRIILLNCYYSKNLSQSYYSPNMFLKLSFNDLFSSQEIKDSTYFIYSFLVRKNKTYFNN